MNTTLSTITRPGDSRATAQTTVWERIWRREPSATRDDELLARERKGPRFAEIVRRIERLFGSVSRVRAIELGSGRGDLSVLLAERGAAVTLLDSNERALDSARQRFARLGLTASFEHADLMNLPQRFRGRYDVAVSLGVIEHFRAQERTESIRAHAQTLRSGGMTVISVPNAWCMPYRMWKFYLELRGCWPYGMELPYSTRELRARARETGFTEIETTRFGFWQSIGDHWSRSLCVHGPDWMGRTSWLDRRFGATLVLFAGRQDA